MALVFLDLDRLKEINDRFGHQGGDLALQEFARRIQRCVRDSDMVARLAGDEFVIVLESLHAPEGVAVVANKLVAALASAFDIDGVACPLSASIGIAVRRDDEFDGEALLHRADGALYDAKTAGRGGFRIAPYG
jgi:diguanylate cyclase (GGDEF)-like protein